MRITPLRAISVVATILIVISVIYLPSPDEVGELILESSPAYLFLVLLLYFANLLVKAFRWYLLLQGGGEISFRSVIPFYTVALALNNLLPGRMAGEPFRLMYIKASDNYSLAQGTATVVWEKGMDMVVVTLMALTGISLLSSSLPGDIRTLSLIVSMALLFTTIVVVALLLKGKLSCIIIPLIRRMNVRGGDLLGRTIPDFVDRFEGGFRGMTSRRLMATTFALTLLIWLNEAVRFFIIYAFVLPEAGWIDPGAVLLAVTLATIASIALPGGGGSVLGLAAVLTALSYPGDMVAAASLLSVATSIWLSFILGGIAMVWINVRCRG